MKKIIFFLLLIFPFSFAAVQWSYAVPYQADTEISLFGENIIFASYEGIIYGLSAEKGEVVFTYNTGKKIIPQIINANESIAFVSQDGELIFLSLTGKRTNSFQLGAKPFSIAVGENTIFVSFNDSVAAYNFNGTLLWKTQTNASTGRLYYSGRRLYFTCDEKLYSLAAETGKINWAALAENSFFSSPALYGTSVYIGATDGRLYSFDAVSGRKQWEFPTEGWIMSTPNEWKGKIFFGSNDGNLYCLTSGGRLFFKFKTGGGIWGKPVLYETAGKTLVVFPSNDGKLYALDASSSQEVWSFSAGGRIGQPASYEEKFIFGTSKGIIYSLSSSPICSFSWPSQNTHIGNWQFEFEGNAYSDSGIARVEIRKAGENWVLADGKESWHATIDFSTDSDGEIKIECRATDIAGRTETGVYSSLSIIKMADTPLRKMFIDAPLSVSFNESFLLSAYDERGKHIRDITVSIEGDKKEGDSPFSVVLRKSGNVLLTVEKEGFETISFYITSKGEESPLLLIAAIVIIIAAATYFLFLRKKK